MIGIIFNFIYQARKVYNNSRAFCPYHGRVSKRNVNSLQENVEQKIDSLRNEIETFLTISMIFKVRGNADGGLNVKHLTRTFPALNSKRFVTLNRYTLLGRVVTQFLKFIIWHYLTLYRRLTMFDGLKELNYEQNPYFKPVLSNLTWFQLGIPIW